MADSAKFSLRHCYLRHLLQCKVCRLDWNKLLPDSCAPSDASSTCQTSGDVVTSKYRELTDCSVAGHEEDGEQKYSTFDVIIASDIVCCESDAVGVSHTLLHFLKRKEPSVVPMDGSHPVALFVVPSGFHR